MMRFSDTSEQDELEPGQEQAEQIYIRDLDTGKYVSMQEYERSRSSNAASADDNDDMGQDDDSSESAKKTWLKKKGSLSKWAKSKLSATRTRLHAIQERVEHKVSLTRRSEGAGDGTSSPEDVDTTSDGDKRTSDPRSSDQRTSAGSQSSPPMPSSFKTHKNPLAYEGGSGSRREGSPRSSNSMSSPYEVEGWNGPPSFGEGPLAKGLSRSHKMATEPLQHSPGGPASGRGGREDEEHGRPANAGESNEARGDEEEEDGGGDILRGAGVELEQLSSAEGSVDDFQEGMTKGASLGPRQTATFLSGPPAKTWSRKPAKKQLGHVCLIQQFQVHDGVVWAMALSPDGTLVATGGQDGIIRIWTINTHVPPRPGGLLSSTQNPDGLLRKTTKDMALQDGEMRESSMSSSTLLTKVGMGMSSRAASSVGAVAMARTVVGVKPAMVLKGHKEDILDIAWSQGTLLLSASVDSTVKLWRADEHDALQEYPHPDMVTSVSFHPSDTKKFVSGCVDGRVRVWSLVEATILASAAVHQDIITAVSFVYDGQQVAAGTMRGKCRFYKCNLTTKKLEYLAQIDVKDAGSSSSASGSRLTCVMDVPHLAGQLLIATNDSRLRRYHGYAQQCKYKGLRNSTTCVRASMSQCGNFVFSGSDDGRVYLWDTLLPEERKSLAMADQTPQYDVTSASGPPPTEPSSLHAPRPKAKNAFYESFQTSDTHVTKVVLAPSSVRSMGGAGEAGDTTSLAGAVFLTVGFTGKMQVYENCVS